MRRFFVNLKRLIKWIPVIWNDRDDEGTDLLLIIKLKLDTLYEEYSKPDTIVDPKPILEDLTEARRLLDILIEDDFEEILANKHEYTFEDSTPGERGVFFTFYTEERDEDIGRRKFYEDVMKLTEKTKSEFFSILSKYDTWWQ